jgi:hypothetical protein
MTIKDFKTKNNLSEINDECVFQSSSLGVAMEYLGLIKDENIKSYIKSRSGLMLNYFDDKNKKVHILTFRELLNLLPERLDDYE